MCGLLWGTGKPTKPKLHKDEIKWGVDPLWGFDKMTFVQFKNINLFIYFLGMEISYKLFGHVMVLKLLLLNSEFLILILIF
jgi:hypothetical protein